MYTKLPPSGSSLHAPSRPSHSTHTSTGSPSVASSYTGRLIPQAPATGAESPLWPVILGIVTAAFGLGLLTAASFMDVERAALSAISRVAPSALASAIPWLQLASGVFAITGAVFLLLKNIAVWLSCRLGVWFIWRWRWRSFLRLRGACFLKSKAKLRRCPARPFTGRPRVPLG